MLLLQEIVEKGGPVYTMLKETRKEALKHL